MDEFSYELQMMAASDAIQSNQVLDAILYEHMKRFAKPNIHGHYLHGLLVKATNLQTLSILSAGGRGFRGSGESRSTQPLTLFLREFPRYYFRLMAYQKKGLFHFYIMYFLLYNPNLKSVFCGRTYK